MTAEELLTAVPLPPDVAVDLQATPGVPHVFRGFAATLTEGDAAPAATGEFLRAHHTAVVPA